MPETSVIVDDFDVDRASVRPTKADPVLSVDSDRMLACAIPFESFEPISGRESQVVQAGRVGDEVELFERASPKVGWDESSFVP
jgi:hypothetical protein